MSSRTDVAGDAFPEGVQIHYRDEPAQQIAASGGFDGVIRAQVENGNQLNSIISELCIRILADWNDGNPIYNTIPLSGAYTNGGFTVTLPETIDAKYLRVVDDSEIVQISDRNAQYFSFNTIHGYDSNGFNVAAFKLHEISGDYSGGDYTEYSIYFHYVDRDVTEYYRAKDGNTDLVLKKGWNKVHSWTHSMGVGGGYTTDQPPEWPESRVKWQFIGG